VQDLAARFARYVEKRLEGATDVRVLRIARIHGGASRETYRVRLTYRREGREQEGGVILRRDPPGSLIETDRRIEFNAYRAFAGTRVPVPRALWLELDPGHLERPFFVMEEIEGCEASPQALLMPPYAAHAEKIAEQKWSILGEIARARPEERGVVGVFPDVPRERAWAHELDYWERVIDEDALEPQPIARAAIRALRRQPPPPPARLHVVHGDFRTGNFLVDPSGVIRGVLDWEMAHLGDPLEDLAWSINRIWCWARDDRVGGLIPRDRAIAIWERASDLRADPAALRWWELFSSVKALAIWLSSAREYRDGRNRDPVLGLTAWWLSNSQDRAILEALGRLK
jgi:aminoglycoside phosphotransferase (APT) family kinase protein